MATHDSESAPAAGNARALAALHTVRNRLLELHRAIVTVERHEYEKRQGRVSAGDFLNVLVNEPSFAWLQPFTAMIVQLDELIDLGASAEEAGWDDCTGQLRSLLRPDVEGTTFQRRYAALLQSSPDVTLAHAALMQALRQ